MKASYLRTVISRVLRAAAGGWQGGLAGLLSILLVLSAQAQQRPAPNFFADDAAARQAAAASPLAATLSSARALTLNVPGLRAALATAPLESQASAPPLLLTLPLPDGTNGRFAVAEAPIMEPALAAQFPAIKTYAGVGLDDPTASVRLDFTPLGFHAQVLSATLGTFYIDPAAHPNVVQYLSFWQRSMPGSQVECGVKSSALQRRASGPALRTSGTVLRAYRLAVAATGEYTAVFGGTVAAGQAAIVTTVNRVVGVYETELAVRLVLVANNFSLVYTNAATDPYNNSNPSQLLTQNQTTIDAIIGTANYDIGHVFTTGGGGLAGLGVVGNANRKAQGETGLPNPVGDAYAIDYVAHEMGHQFGANHTFNTTDGNRNASTAYEPGSGSTIMGYAGVFNSAEDLQSNSDPYFHVASFEEILNFVDVTIPTVGIRAATGNIVPLVSPGPTGYRLPLSTPFALTATGTDGNGDVLTYCWEEYDLGPAVLLSAAQNTTSPLFRSFLPTTNPTRTFPRLTNLVANTSTTSEKLPTLARDLKFRVTARDNRAGGGGVNSSEAITLTTVAGTGPFVVTAPNTAVSWAGNSTQTVTWDVAGTNANGINCAQVSLLLSTDGGFTYPTTLLASTGNDGSETITVPNTPTTTARVRVQAVGNVFFDISNANFTITAAPPVTAVSSVRAGASPTNAAVVSFTVTFSGAVSGLSASNFAVLTTGSVAGASVLSVTGTGTGTTYTVAVNTGTGSGTVQLQLNNTTGISPTVSNVPFVGESYTIDKTAPTVAITSPASSPTSTSPIPVTVTFSEAVTGFAASDVVVGNGTITSAIINSGNAYSFSVTPVAAGPVTVDVAANGAQDAAGNGNLAAPQFSIIYQPAITSSVWTGAISTDWFTAGNWTAGVPTATLDAIINPSSSGRQPLINAGTATSKNLVINTGASLTMSGGTLDVRGDWTNNATFTATDGTVVFGRAMVANGPNIYGSSLSRFWNLTVQASGVQLSTSAGAAVRRVLALTGSFTTQGNPLTLESTATSTALVVNSGGVVVGNATVQRAIDPSVNQGLGYRHYSAPVSTSTVADLATTTGFTPVINPNYNTSATPTLEVPFPNVYGYDESRTVLTNNLGSFDKGYFSPTALANPLTVGRGYTVNLNASQVVDFVGALNNGDQLLSLSNTRASNADAGWHLVGNPYPAPLDYRLVVATDRENLEGAIYVFSSTSQYGGQYRVYNNNIGNPIIPLGQGFFVRTAGTSAGALTFRNSQRLTAPNATTFQRPAADPRPLVQLTLQGTGRPTTDATYIYFEAGATAGFDADFDARKLPNDTGLNLSSGAASTALAINGLPLPGTAPLAVPLAVGVPVAGTYSLTADQLLNLPNTPVYLRDVQLGTLTDLHQQPGYTFTVANASALLTNRFELLFSPRQALATVPAALAQQVAVYPNPAHAAVTIDLPAALSRQPVMATLVSALGQVVRQQELPAGRASYALPLADVAAGVYSLRLRTEAGVVVKKVVVD